MRCSDAVSYIASDVLVVVLVQLHPVVELLQLRIGQVLQRRTEAGVGVAAGGEGAGGVTADELVVPMMR